MTGLQRFAADRSREARLAFLGLLALTMPARAQPDCIDYAAYLHFTEAFPAAHEITGAAIVGQLAYVADRSRLHVVDLTDPHHLRERGSASYVPCRVLATDGQLLVCAGSNEGQHLAVVDVSVVDAPTVRGSIAGLVSPRDVALAGSLAYVADGGGGLRIVSLADPDRPVLASTLAVGTAVGVCAIATLACVATSPSGLHFVDCTDPDHPSVLSRIDVPCQGGIDHVSGLVAIAAGTSGVRFVDASDPRDPLLLGGRGGLGNVRDVALTGRIVLVASDDGLRTLDVRNPAHPIPTGEVKLAGISKAVAAFEGGACVASATSGLSVVRGTAAGSPPPLGGGTAEDASEVAVDGDVAYVADGSSGLKIIRITPWTRPETLSTTALPAEGAEALAVGVEHGYTAVAAGDLGLVVYDVRDARAPALLATLDTGGLAVDVALGNDLAFVADLSGGVHAVDLHNPSAPVLLGTALVVARKLALGPRVVYVTEASGLAIVDVANPRAPSVLGRLGLERATNDVAAEGGIACVAADSAVYVVDVSDPTRPTLLTERRMPERCTAVSIRWPFGYVAAKSGGLEILDLCEPDAARRAGSTPTPGAAVAVLAAETGVIVANGPRGLSFHNLDCAEPPAEVSGLGAEFGGRVVHLTWTATWDTARPTFNVERRTGRDAFVRVNPAPVGGDGLFSFLDAAVEEQTRYTYRLTATQCGMLAEVATLDVATPDWGPHPPELALEASPSVGAAGATLRFTLPGPGPVRLTVFDAGGRRVRELLDAEARAGQHIASWDGRTASGAHARAGFYVVRLTWGTAQRSQRLVLAR